MQQHDLLDIFAEPLEKGSITYMITGSVASTFYGEPRLTYDIDLVIMLKKPDIDAFIALFSENSFYCPPKEIIQIEIARASSAHFNLIHHDSGYKADIYIFTGNALHSWAFKNRQRIDIHSDLQIWVAPPEYVIIRKLQYFKEGGSQKHLSDIKKMLDSSETKIDKNIVKDWVDHLGIQQEWLKAQEHAFLDH